MYSLDDAPSGIYTRASYDRSAGTAHEGVSVASQEADCRAAAARLGSHVVEVYTDNDLSASRYSTKTRSDWDRLLADIEAGRLQLVILWESARASRKLWEWAQFLELCREHCPYLHLVSQDETYDIRKPRDWKILATEGIDSASESDKISARVRRGQAAARASGRPAGHAPFGYRRVYDPDSGRLTTQEPVPEQAAMVAELFERVAGGEPLTAIARDFSERTKLPEGDPARVPSTRHGHQWAPRRLRAMALCPAYMGWRRQPDSGELVKGNWDPIVPESLWRTVSGILESRARSGSRPGRAKYLLTNIIKCGLCGSRMGVFTVDRALRYVCKGINEDGSPKGKKGCTAIRLSWADDHVTALAKETIADPDALAELVSEESAEGASARIKADEIRSDLSRMWESVKARVVDFEDYLDAKRAWEPQIARLEEQAAGLDRASSEVLIAALRESVAAAEDRAEVADIAWEETPLSGQRDLVKLFFPKLRVMPGTPGRHVFDPDRIKID